MKFKLDENVPRLGRDLLQSRGHDVQTVPDQGLSGISDDDLFRICADEGRILVTLDRDFGQIPRFPPDRSRGIAVLQFARRVTPNLIVERLAEMLAVLQIQSIAGSLWIVEPGRVRIHIARSSQ